MGYDGSITIGTEVDTSQFDKQIAYVESQMREIEDKVKQADLGFEVGDVAKLDAQYEKLGISLTKLNEKKAKFLRQGFDSVKNSVDGVGESVRKTIKNIGRWALAVFGIRSAYLAVRSAMSVLSETNDELRADLDYIRFSIANALAPLVERLIGLAFVLLNAVNQIAMGWFGVNLFANASADAFDKANKSAKELRKATAGFDEMNVLGGGASPGDPSPSFDLANPEDIPVPSWIKWIAENKDTVIEALMGIAFGLTAIKLGLTLIEATGIGLILIGLYIAIKGIVEFISDPSWDSFLTILQGIALVIAGIAFLMGGWVIALIALGAALIIYLIKNWDKVKEKLGDAATWIWDKVIKPIGDFFVGLWDGLSSGASFAWEAVKAVFKGTKSFFSGIFDNIKSVFKDIGQAVGSIVASAFKAAINAVLSVADGIINAPINAINKLLGVINKVPGIEIGKLSTIPIPRLASGGIINLPNTGVSLPGAIGGEAGAEGVIPLTDGQAMEQLGEAIGRHVTFEANIINNMNGRTISRALQTIKGNNDFVMNR